MLKPIRDLMTVSISSLGSTSFSLFPPAHAKIVSTNLPNAEAKENQEGFFDLLIDSRFSFTLEMQSPYGSAHPIVSYGGETLIPSSRDGSRWTYTFSVKPDAKVEMDIAYREFSFSLDNGIDLVEGLSAGKIVLAPEGPLSFRLKVYYPNQGTRPTVNVETSDGSPYTLEWTDVEHSEYESTYSYRLNTTANAAVKVSLSNREVSLSSNRKDFFSVSSIELNKTTPWNFGTSRNVPAGERLGFIVEVTDPKYWNVMPGVIFNGVLIQPDSLKKDKGLYYYSAKVRESASILIDLNCVTVILSGVNGGAISLVSPAADTFYVTPGAQFKFRLQVNPPYSSIVPSVKVQDGDYLMHSEVGGNLYDYSYPVSSRLTPIHIDARLSTNKVTFSVLSPGVELLAPNFVYLPQTVKSYAFTLRVDETYAYVTPQVTVGSTTLAPAARDGNLYTYVLSESFIRENPLVDIRMIYARVRLTLSKEVEIVSTDRMVQSDGWYYLHADSPFNFALRVISGSLIDAPAVIATAGESVETLVSRPLGEGCFAYSFNAKAGETDIEVAPYRGITFGSDIPAEITLLSHSRGTHYVPAGSKFEFKLKVKSSYRNVIPSVTIEGNNGEPAKLINSDDTQNLYTFSLTVKDDAVLHFSLKTQTLRFATLPAGVTFLSNPGPFVQAPSGGTFTFSVQVDDAHSSIIPNVSAGRNPVTLLSTDNATHTYTYVVTANTSATVLVALANAVFLSAELPEGMALAGNNGEGTYHLSYGQPFSFSVKKSSDLGEQLRPSAYATTADKTWEILPIVEGEYFNFSLQEVTTNTEILVNVNYRTLTLPTPPSNLVLLNPSPGTHVVGVGGTFYFTLRAADVAYAAVPPTVTSRNELSYVYDPTSGTYLYTLKALYDDNLSFGLNYVSVNVNIATEGVTLASPAGPLSGKQTIYAPIGRDFTLTLDLQLKDGLNSTPTVVVDQVERVVPTEVAVGVYEAKITNMMKDKSVKVLIPRYSIAKTVGISFLIANGVKVSLAGYEYRSMAQYTLQQGDPCLFYFQTDEPYLNAEVSLLVNGLPYLPVPLGGGNYAVNLGIVSFDTNIQILMSASKNTDVLSPADAVKISADGNQVTVETETETPAAVYTLTGRLILQRKINGKESFTLPAGIYIVRAGEETVKIRISNR
jgi:hypothetical protein